MTASTATSVRELETPYSEQAGLTSVATPSCCCCCCCCLTAGIVGPVFLGVNTNATAVKNGRKGALLGVLAGLALPITTFGVGPVVSAIAAESPGSEVTGVVFPIIVLMMAIGAVTAARYFAGDSAQRALVWGVIAALVWVISMTLNFLIDLAFVFVTLGIGILVEVALIPLWVFLIVRAAGRKKEQLGTASAYPTYEPYLPYPPLPGEQPSSPYGLPPPPGANPGVGPPPGPQLGPPQDPYA